MREPPAGIVDQRRASVADEGYGATASELLEQFRRALTLVVIMQADERLANLLMLKQLQRPPRILARDQIDGLQRLECSQRDIAQVPDRRGHDVQRPAHS